MVFCSKSFTILFELFGLERCADFSNSINMIDNAGFFFCVSLTTQMNKPEERRKKYLLSMLSRSYFINISMSKDLSLETFSDAYFARFALRLLVTYIT